MQRQIIIPINDSHWLDLRAQDLTSTDIAALFGCSPYLTEFECWHRKKDKLIVKLQPNERIRWGNRLESAIARGIADDHAMEIRPMKEYIRIPELKLGSSFDFSVEKSDHVEEGILEIKNVDALQFKDGWIVDGDKVEAPLHIELQAQHQLLVSGRQYLAIGALVGGNRVVLIHREADLEVHRAIITKAEAFWKSIDEGIVPSPNFEKDASFISSLYKYAEPGKILEADKKIESLADMYKTLSDELKRVTSAKDAIKAEILTIIKDAEKVKSDKFTISAGIVAPAEISYTREGYRSFKLTWKKEKA